jgi:Ni/Co efflux regulator RcnB
MKKLFSALVLVAFFAMPAMAQTTPEKKLDKAAKKSDKVEKKEDKMYKNWRRANQRKLPKKRIKCTRKTSGSTRS